MDLSLRELHASLGIPVTYHKTTKLECFSEPKVLVAIGNDVFGRPQKLEEHAASAWFDMRGHALQDGVTLQVVSAYRSPEYQAEVIQRLLDKGEFIENILLKVAAPGFSEHQSGRALDLTAPGFEAVEEEFENSTAFAWLTEYAEQHEFQLSYPRNNPHGVIYEPWHWCHRASD